MMPYQTYQLYQIERPKKVAELRNADDRAGRAAATIAGILRRLTPTAYRGVRPDCAIDHPAVPCGYSRMTSTMEAR